MTQTALICVVVRTPCDAYSMDHARALEAVTRHLYALPAYAHHRRKGAKVGIAKRGVRALLSCFGVGADVDATTGAGEAGSAGWNRVAPTSIHAEHPQVAISSMVYTQTTYYYQPQSQAAEVQLKNPARQLLVEAASPPTTPTPQEIPPPTHCASEETQPQSEALQLPAPVQLQAPIEEEDFAAEDLVSARLPPTLPKHPDAPSLAEAPPAAPSPCPFSAPASTARWVAAEAVRLEVAEDEALVEAEPERTTLSSQPSEPETCLSGASSGDNLSFSGSDDEDVEFEDELEVSRCPSASSVPKADKLSGDDNGFEDVVLVRDAISTPRYLAADSSIAALEMEAANDQAAVDAADQEWAQSMASEDKAPAAMLTKLDEHARSAENNAGLPEQLALQMQLPLKDKAQHDTPLLVQPTTPEASDNGAWSDLVADAVKVDAAQADVEAMRTSACSGLGSFQVRLSDSGSEASVAVQAAARSFALDLGSDCSGSDDGGEDAELPDALEAPATSEQRRAAVLSYALSVGSEYDSESDASV